MKKVAATILFYIIILCCVVAILKTGAAISCNDIRKETNMPSKYSMISGCYVQDPAGHWWPI